MTRKTSKPNKGSSVKPLTPQQAWAALAFDKQLKYVREIVETRSHELSRAYPQVERVMAGVKRARNKAKDAKLLKRPEPAVIFVVQKKVRSKKSLGDDVIQPLLHYCMVRRRPCLCEIPVDVEERTRYSRVTLDSDPANVKVNPETGTITCAVDIPPRRRDGVARLAALSCRHVFHNVGASVDLNGVELGRVKYQGRLATTGASYDIGLAIPETRRLLREALGNLFLTSWATGHDQLPGEYWIRTPRGPLPLTYRADFDGTIPYPGVGDVRQVLIESRVMNESTVGGDSGAPVVANPDGGRLLGIHVAGDGDRGGDSAFMVPIWFALKTNHWETAGLPPNELLRIKRSLGS